MKFVDIQKRQWDKDTKDKDYFGKPASEEEIDNLIKEVDARIK